MFYIHFICVSTYSTNKPTYRYQLYSQIHTNDVSEEPTELTPLTLMPSNYVVPSVPMTNFTCVCKYDNRDNTKLIIIASVSSTFCFILLLLLIWYRFIFKKKLLKWQTNEANFGFGSVEI